MKTRTAFWFSIVADEAIDISHHEQMSLRVDEDYTIHEDILGLVQLLDTKAATTFKATNYILIRCTVPSMSWPNIQQWSPSTGKERKS